ACPQQPSLLGVSITPGPDGATGPEGWLLTLEEEGAGVAARLRDDTWTVTEPGAVGGNIVPNACFGGWLDQNTLRFDVIFLETPHRLSVTCRLPHRVFDAEWATAPLNAPTLRDLRAPNTLSPHLLG